MEGGGDIRDAILACLNATLSPDHATRTNAETKLKALEVTDDFGIHLARFTCDPNNGLDFTLRQMAAVLLRQYVETHWSSEGEKFQPPETAEVSKAEIRALLPIGLKQDNSKVRSSVAYAISAVAYWDFPDNWPNLFNVLMEALTSGNNDAVSGAMSVMKELSRDVTDMQVPHIAPIVFPELYRIFSRVDIYQQETRTHAVEIFSTLGSLIINIDSLHKGVAKQILYPYAFPQFIQAFVEELRRPYNFEKKDSAIKIEIFKCLASLTKNCGKKMNDFMGDLLPVVSSLLTSTARYYCETIVNRPDDAEDPDDPDEAEQIQSIENFIFSLIDFLTSLLESSKFQNTVKGALTDLVYYVILFMQMTRNQIDRWNEDPDKFVEEEDEDTFSYSVRISALDLLLNMGAEIEGEAVMAALVAAVGRHLEESELQRNEVTAGNPSPMAPFWWKIHESVFLSVGSLKTLFEDNSSFDVGGFVNGVLMRDACADSSSPYLLGRCLWTASRFCSSLDPSSASNLLSATANALSPHHQQPPCVKISAIRALYSFCDYYKLNETTEMLRPYMEPFFDGMIAVALQFSTDVLCLCLETLALFCSIDRDFVATRENKISPFVIAIFLKHSADPLISSLCQDLFRELSLGPSRPALEQRLVPTLVSIMNAPPEKIENDLPSLALDVLTTVVRNSPPPLSEQMILQALPAAATMTLNSDDTSILQSGGECLRAFLSVGGRHQLEAWRDESGNNGLSYVFQVANKVLDPKSPEFSSAYIGKLISTLFYKTGDSGDLGEHLELTLRAVLSKLQQAETMSVIQSLCMVFAHLFNTRLEAALEFLSGLPDPTGKPALEFVLTVWLARQHLFYGRYDTKVSILALAKLFLHTVETNDTRIHAIQVKGDQITTNNNSIKTRSKTKSSEPQWTQIPAAVKIYKLLLNELSHSLEEKEGEDEDELDNDEEDEEDDEAVDGGAVLSDLLASGDSGINDKLACEFRDFYEEGDDEEEDDPDIKDDPIHKMDIGQYLGDMCRQLSTHACHSELQTHLTPAELKTLNKIGIST